MTNIFPDMARIARLDEPMARHTTIGVGGAVSYLVEPRDAAQVAEVWRRASAEGLPLKVLGRGSNTLVADGSHRWLVLSTARLDRLEHSGTELRAGAGVPLSRLLAAAGAWGLGGLEHLAGIPGSVGGAVAMNAGGRHGAIGDTLLGATVVPGTGEPRWASAAELRPAYRGSAIRGGLPFLLEAVFALRPDAPRRLHERRRRFLLAKKAAQPLGARSAGCVFKNPPGRGAGWLIDRAGLKGAAVGGAIVSHKHANFILNRGGATASDVLTLIALIRQRVRERFGVALELEIEVWKNGQGGTDRGTA